MRSKIILYLIIFFLVNKANTVPPCTPCITKTYRDRQITDTLVYFSDYECSTKNITVCLHQETSYRVCWGIKPTCYKPESNSIRARVNVYAYSGSIRGQPVINNAMLVASNVTLQTDQGLQVCFDVCGVLSKTQGYKIPCHNLDWERSYVTNRRYFYTESGGKASTSYAPSTTHYAYYYASLTGVARGPPRLDRGPDPWFNLTTPPVSTHCSKSHCTPLCLHFSSTATTEGTRRHIYGIGVDGRGRDPFGSIVVEMLGYKPAPAELKVHATFWKEMRKIIEIPPVTKNLFIDLAERIAGELMVKNCYVCGGTTFSDQWIWQSMEIPLTNLSAKFNLTWADIKRPNRWVLGNRLVGELCFIRQGGPFKVSVGQLDCETGWVCNNSREQQFVSFSNRNVTTEPSFVGLGPLQEFWTFPCNASWEWVAPDSFYWICGTTAYAVLPRRWSGACVLGTIKPGFFLLPLSTGERLEVTVYESLGRPRRSIPSFDDRTLHIGSWKDDEWPPERIVQVYGPATWAADGTYGYRTPIYMLNRIIRLQAVLEIITNETSMALSLLAKTNTQMRTAIYQNRLALDYLLAEEGGVCGKFNLTNCCLQIDDNGKAIEQITERMRNLAHVPVQTWSGMFETEGWFSGIFGDWKRTLFLVGLAFGGLLMLPCLLPLIRGMVNRAVLAVTPPDAVPTKLMYLSASERRTVYHNRLKFNRPWPTASYSPAKVDNNRKYKQTRL